MRARCARRGARASGTARVQEVLVQTREHNVKAAKHILRSVDLLRQGHRARVKKYHELQSAEQALISLEFRRKLKTGRNWKGQIDIDYEGKTVQLHVVPTKGAPPSPPLAC